MRGSGSSGAGVRLKNGGHRGDVLTAALSLCLSLAFLDVIWLVHESPSYFSRSSIFGLSAPAAVGLLSFLVMYAVVFAAFSWTIGRLVGGWPVARAVGVGVFVATVLSIGHYIEMRPGVWTLTQLARNGHLLIIMFLPCVVLGIAAYIVAEGVARSERGSKYSALFAMGIPIALGESSVFYWLVRIRLGATTWLGSLAITLAYLLVVSGSVWLFYRFGRRLRPLRWVVAMVVVVFVVGVGYGGALGLGRMDVRKGGDAERQPHHIVLLTIDALRADHLSCYGATATSTPNMDRLGEEGVVFERAMSQAPWTLPALASILTGVPVAVHGTRGGNSALPESFETVSERLRDTGYLTAAFVINPYANPIHGLSQGFEHYVWFSRRPVWAAGPLSGELLRMLFRHRASGEPTSQELTDMVVAWLERNHERDFFLWVHYFDPHAPYAPPARFQPTGRAPGRIGMDFCPARAEGERFIITLASPVEKDWVRKLYAGEVDYVDDCVGQLMSAFKRLGVYDDALIILSSDHGEEFWEHNGYLHAFSVYQELIHVPLIVRPPAGVGAGMRVEGVVRTMDIMPTILAACGIEWNLGDVREGICARDLSPLWRSVGDDPERVSVSEGVGRYEDRRGIHFGNLKYIRWLESGHEELYDLAADPGEKMSRVDELTSELATARSKWEDYSERAQGLAELLGVAGPREVVMSEDQIRRLRALGYVR